MLPLSETFSSQQEKTVARWVQRRLGSIEHEQRVATIATTLFELTRNRHGLGYADLRMLRMAACVHDVGRAVCDETHPEEGRRMLLADTQLPVTTAQRRLLAYLTLHHKGAVPAAGDDSVLAEADDADRALTLLALLRSADALDSRSLSSPRLVFALVGRRLSVTCYLQEECAKARKVYRRRKKFRLLEELLDCRVEIDIAHAEGLRLVA
jgi:exopolyphosphatase/pppGpp-phosphohydrolase